MNKSQFPTNNKQVIEDTKDPQLIENICNLKKGVKQELDGCRVRNREKLDNFRASLVEERVDDYFRK